MNGKKNNRLSLLQLWIEEEKMACIILKSSNLVDYSGFAASVHQDRIEDRQRQAAILKKRDDEQKLHE